MGQYFRYFNLQILKIQKDLYQLRCSAFLYSFCYVLLSVVLSACGASSNKQSASSTDTLIAPITLPAPLALATTEKQRLKNGCEKWYDTVLKNRGFNGGILVAKKGTIIFEAYNGTGHLPGNDFITDTTPTHIASVSKTFTAMAVLQLWQNGKLNIDDELSAYFPGFNYQGVTVRSLLNHRSGLPNYVYFMEMLGWDKTKYVTNEDVLRYLKDKKTALKNIAPPNAHFAYCNTNYALLALLIEKVSGKKYSNYIKDVFFTPLGMTHSFVFDTIKARIVNPSYDWRGRIIPFGFLDAVYGDKNIYTTPRDLLVWDRALSSDKLFSQKILDEAYTPYSNEKPGIRNYGLGWRMNIYPSGKKMIYHNGWWHGNNAAFIRLLEDSTTIIVIGNKFNRGIYHARDMAKLFGDYGGTEEEEEGEASNRIVDTTTSLTQKKVASIQPTKKIMPIKKIVPIKKEQKTNLKQNSAKKIKHTKQ
jgi:CubicO group peptidase (beta-lactamase class C family)